MSARATVTEPAMAIPTSAGCRARAYVKLVIVVILYVLMCREQRHAFIRAGPWDRAASGRHNSADQVRIRGGWSGGGPTRPSATKSTSAKDSLRVWKTT